MATKTSAPPWRSRIVGEGEEAPDQLLANPLNWRVHPKAQQDALAGVLSEVGWVQRVIVNQQTGHVVDGHARIGLAISRGEPSVPVLYVDLAPDEEAKVLATLDPIAALAGADNEVLDQLLREVSAGDAAVFQLLTDLAADNGLTYGEGGLLAGEAPEPEIERAAELLAKWGVRRGDVWKIGRHRLMCGDSTKAEDVARLMGGERATMSYCDPPYAVGVSTTGLKSSLADLKILVPFFRDWLLCLRMALVNGGHWYISTDWRTYPLVFEVVVPLGLTNCIVWDYDWIKAGSQYRFRYELILFGVWGDTQRKVPRDEPDVWQHRAENFTTERMHSAQKPLAVMDRAIRNSSDPGDIVLDLFVGSGGTLHAAELSQRRGYGMDVDPQYVAVTLERLAAMGLEPRRVEAGEG